MHHATADLHAPPAATRTATTGPRSRAPGVLVALGASGVATAVAGLVVVLAVTPGVTVTDLDATPVTQWPGQASIDPTPLTGGDNRSEVEIRELVSTGLSASIVVRGATGAVIELPPVVVAESYREAGCRWYGSPL